MKITRLTAPAFPSLTEEQINEWLRLDFGSDTTTIAMLLASATEMVEGITNLTLGSANYRIDYHCGGRSFPLPIEPVQAVVSVEIDGEPVTYTERGNAILLDVWATGDISVTVTAGFSDPTHIPQSLQHAIAVIAGAGYDGREAIDPATQKTVDWLCARHRRLVL